MSYPILYKANETNFEHLGVSVLSDALSCLVTRERNGIYTLEMEYPNNGKDAKKIKEGMILRADAGYRAKNQRFIISQITDNMNGTKKVYCKHISQVKTMMNAIKPNITVAGTAHSALTEWKFNLLDSRNEFNVWSDIGGSFSTTWDISNIENARDALGGKQGSILDVWGGEYEFDNLTIKLHKQMGRDVSTIIAYGRNLIELEQESSILETYTSVYPFVKYTDTESETQTSNEEILVTLPEFFIDSPHANKFTHKRILKVDFSSDDDIKTIEQLRKRTERYIKDNRIGVPKVNLTIKYQDLSKVASIWNNQPIEEVDLCDRIKVYYEDLDIINDSAKVIKVVWNVLLDENEEIEVGDARSSFASSVGGVTQEDLNSLENSMKNYQKTDFDKRVEENIAMFERMFAEEKKKIEDSVKTGIEEAKLKAVQEQDKIKLEIATTIAEATKDVPKIREDYQKDINQTKKDLENMVTGKIAAIDIPDVENIVDRKIAEIPKEEIKVGARNYILNSGECTSERRKNYKLATDDWSIFRGKTVIVSVDVEARDASGTVRGSQGSNNFEVAVRFVDGSTFYGAQVFNTNPNFKGRIFKKVTIPNKEITSISAYTRNDWATGFYQTCKPMLEIATTPADWRPAEEDNKGYLDNKFVEYTRTVDGEISKFSGVVDGATRVANEAKNTATAVQNSLNSVTQRFNNDGSLKEFKTFENSYNRTAQETTKKLEALESYKNADGTRRDEIIRATSTETARQITEEREVIKRDYIAKSKYEEDVRGITRTFNEQLNNITVGARNYVLDSNICTTETQKNFNLSVTDLSIFRGKTVIVSADAEAINVSGSRNGRSRQGVEFSITFVDGSTVWPQAFNYNSNFKGRLVGKFTIPDKEIKSASFYVQNQFSSGISRMCRPMLEIANTPADYQPAPEDTQFYADRKVAEYKQTVDGTLSRLEQSDRAGNIKISDMQQSINTISSSLSITTADFNKYKTDRVQTDKTINDKVASLEKDTLKVADINITSDGIRLGASKTIDKSTVASMIVTNPEAVKAITDTFVVTAHNENYIREEQFKNFRKKDRSAITPFYENSGAFKLNENDEFLVTGEVRNIIGNSNSDAQIILVTRDGREHWKSLGNFSFPSTKNFTNTQLSKKINNLGVNLNDVVKYRFGFRQDANTEYEYRNLSFFKKKDASFIVDGSITGRQVKAESFNGGEFNGGAFNVMFGKALAMETEKAKIKDAIINNITVDNALINKLTAKSAFVQAVQAIDVSADRITAGVLRSPNDWMKIDLYNGHTTYNGNGTIEFKNKDNMLFRKKRYTQNGQNRDVTAFLKFQDDAYGGTYTVLGVDSHGGGDDYVGGEFAGIRIIRTNSWHNPKIDKIQLVADSVHFSPEQELTKEFLRIHYRGTNETNGKRVDLMKFIGNVVRRLKMRETEYVSNEWK